MSQRRASKPETTTQTATTHRAGLVLKPRGIAGPYFEGWGGEMVLRRAILADVAAQTGRAIHHHVEQGGGTKTAARRPPLSATCR
jgi:hypothetical protein